MEESTETPTLVEFLRARLDERAAKARAAMNGGEGRWTPVDPLRQPGRIQDERREVIVYDEGSPNEDEAAHIAENDPARVLREVAAKRRIVDAYAAQVAKRQHIGVLHDAELATGGEDSLEVAELMGKGIAVNSWINHLGWTLRVIATTYADHPDYQQEWKP